MQQAEYHATVERPSSMTHHLLVSAKADCDPAENATDELKLDKVAVRRELSLSVDEVTRRSCTALRLSVAAFRLSTATNINLEHHTKRQDSCIIAIGSSDIIIVCVWFSLDYDRDI